MACIEIDAVRVNPAVPERLWGANVDRPVSGASLDAYSFILAGWALDRAGPGGCVEVLMQEDLVTRLPLQCRRVDVAATFPHVPASELSGFSGVVRTLGFAKSFELKLELVGPDASRQFIASLRGRRRSLPGRSAAGIQPLLITALGRTGTSFLALLLSSHPAVIVAPPFPFENRVVHYWISVLSALADPCSYLQQVASQNDLPYWWLGDPGYSAETYIDRDEHVQWLGGGGVDKIGTFAAHRIAAYYQRLAQAQGQPHAAYFVEKILPTRWMHAPFGELFPSGRELILVRDFRDMVGSVLAFNNKRKFASFGRELVTDDISYIRSLRDPISRLARAWKVRGDSAHLVRYENLVERPRDTLRDIFAYLGIAADSETVDLSIASAATKNPELQMAHRTSAGGLSSIGRWARDLPAELQRACHETFGDFLRAFDYAV